MNIGKRGQLGAVLLTICLLFVISGIAIYDFTPADYGFVDFLTPLHVDREWHASQMRLMLLKDQLLFFGQGFVAMYIMYRWHTLLSRRWLASAIVALLMLIAPFLPEVGMSIEGHRRWFWLGSVPIQSGVWALFPAAFALSHLLSTIETEDADRKRFVLLGLFFTAISGLFLVQPDLPMFVLFNCLTLVLVLSGNCAAVMKKKIALAAASISGAGVTLFSLIHPIYVKCSFNSITYEKYSFSYVYQSILALNDLKLGGLNGIGLGSYYLSKPVYPIDTKSKFILQIIGREFGFVGIMVVIVLFAIIAWLSLERIKTIAGSIEKKIATAMLSLIILPAVLGLLRTLNLLSLIPSYDIPFLGYGAASVIGACGAVGIVFSSAFDAESGTGSKGGEPT